MTLENLKDRLEIQRALVLHCSNLFGDTSFLVDKLIPKYQKGNKIHLFLERLNNYFHGILIIELLKLYNKKEYYSIWETLNQLKNNYNKSNWKGKISQQNYFGNS
ncbi:hypothetical protein ES705_38286 [subsurface metagenome]